MGQRGLCLLGALGAGLALGCASSSAEDSAPASAGASAYSVSEILERAPASDWRVPDPQNTLYLELPGGRVVFELAPQFAPNLIGNLRLLVKDGYFDGSALIRAQDNYVVQWARPEDDPKPFGAASERVAAEFYRPFGTDLSFTVLPDPDTYAAQTGFVDGFPVGRGPVAGADSVWLAHCYGMLGVGRDIAPETGNGGELYVVIGHAPRHLDRNVVLIGRTLAGIELLSTLPRGGGPLGFYETPEENTAVLRMRFAADTPVQERSALEVLRTDSASFAALIEARRFRKDEWFVDQAGRLSLCNTPIPVRERAGS